MRDAGESAEAIIATWEPGLTEFNARASAFHLYT